jgi:hypothetical protein
VQYYGVKGIECRCFQGELGHSMLFEQWVEIQCSPSSSTTFKLPNGGADYEEHHLALLNQLVEVRQELPGSLWHLKYTGGPWSWTDFVRIRGSLADCDRLVRAINARNTASQLGVFVPRAWDPLAGMLKSHAGLRLNESVAILTIWRDWCDTLLKLFSAGEIRRRRSEARTHSKVWFDTGDPSAIRDYLDQQSVLKPKGFDSLLGTPAALAGIHNGESAAYSAGPHLFMNSLCEEYHR